MKIFTYILSVIMVLGVVIVPSHAGTDAGQDLTKQLSAVCIEIHKIKPGMTRAELTKLFRVDTGGVAWPATVPLPFEQHQSFIYRSCWLIMVDVDFASSDSKEARPTDIISKISKPYLNDSPRV
jgi:hypothetical protein